MIIGQTQNIKPDKNGVCPCPICPKGNLLILTMGFAFKILSDFLEELTCYLSAFSNKYG